MVIDIMDMVAKKNIPIYVMNQTSMVHAFAMYFAIWDVAFV